MISSSIVTCLLILAATMFSLIYHLMHYFLPDFWIFGAFISISYYNDQNECPEISFQVSYFEVVILYGACLTLVNLD